MTARTPSEAFLLYASQITGSIEDAFEDLSVRAYEVEHGAIRLTLHARRPTSQNAQFAAAGRISEVRALLEAMGWTLAPPVPFGQLTVLFPCYVVGSRKREFIKLKACVSYEERQKAKDAGYSWSPGMICWWTEIELAQLESHREKVPFEVKVLSSRAVTEYRIVPEELSDPEGVGQRAGRLLAAQRKTFGGPPKVLRPCPHCGENFSARSLRVHTPRCPPTHGDPIDRNHGQSEKTQARVDEHLAASASDWLRAFSPAGAQSGRRCASLPWRACVHFGAGASRRTLAAPGPGKMVKKIARRLMCARGRGFGWKWWSSSWFYERLGLFSDYELLRWGSAEVAPSQ